MTKTSELIWHNGDMIPYEQATTHILSHALHYGSSVFEGVRAYETAKGPAIFRLKDHIKRLFDSAKIYRMEIPFTEAQLMQACKDAVKANGFTNAYLRPFAFLGNVGLGVHPKSHKADVSVAAMEWGTYLGDGSLEQGVDACISSWTRLAPNTMPTGAKAGGNYLSSQLITAEAKRHGYVEGIALDVNGYLSEGAGENLFVIKNGVLFTPPTTACILPGLTRDTIMKLARERGYEVREESIAREALYLADEFFMTGTAAEVTPVRSVDQIQIGDGKRGPITQELQQAYFDLVKGQSEDSNGWLDYIND
ncbi:Branched-chain-amino-acid aminotransferase [Pseudoalteromonas holothuriae]|uniref:Branched-chain-amino-acid aminotransferase n=1 Tax=Pseudoalteromonas holothuriae TaxID=2963714 RepID=A0A9W4QVW2_9GAMM|nr:MULTISPECIES: branched-chain amino acid transaminase [unclassified Pseudoalteromonas]CAH9055419.1 Branched-chain-amino-acid aminotransferase [Pseudoalteromonas sp. CIP111854]CAH9062916.1 Branched-chain-amino-acid aminotransferase [Pseudoalteromonas sp. CIP111951]